MKRGARTAVILAGALMMLFGSLVAFLLVRLRERPNNSWLNQISEGWLGDHLLTVTFGLMIMVSFVLVALAMLALLTDVSESRRPTPNKPARPMPNTETDSSKATSPPVAGRPEDGPWMRLVEECVEVVDELDRHMNTFDAPRREVAEHVVLRMEEVLERSGVEVISDEPIFDRGRHQPVGASATTSSGAAIAETLSPGFAVGRRVLRRARVRVR